MEKHIKKYMVGISVGALLAACSSGQNAHHHQNAHHGAQQGGAYMQSPQQNAYMMGQAYSQPQATYGQPAYGMQPSYMASATSKYSYANRNHQQGIFGNNFALGQSPGHSFPPLRNGYGGGGYKGSKFSYESLNAFEEPVSAEIAGVTFEVNGRLDSVTDISLENDTDPNHRLVGSHRINAEKQLSNRYTIGADFTGRAEDIGNSNADYKGRVRGYVGGSWGSLWGGNVRNIVFEDTRRLRGAGRLVGNGVRETNLGGDGALGALNLWGGGYRGRFGPTIVTAMVDDDANYDVGVEFQRPIGSKDYRITARHNTGTYTAADGVTEIDTTAVTGVGEYVYGSTRYDLSAGYEELDTGVVDADRWFTSAGITTKAGVVSLTVEGQYGEIEGQQEMSALAALKYDITRGLSATAAVDYQDRQVTVGALNLINTKDTRALLGLSYGF